jgi:uncharacterized protein YkwD
VDRLPILDAMRRHVLLAVLATAVALAAAVGPVGPAVAAAPSTGTAATTAQETRVLALVNRARAAARCPALRRNAALTRAARGHSLDMARRNYFAHVTPGGTSPWTRIARAGYPRAALAENIAAGQRTADAVVRAWLASPGHRRNILNCSMRSVGTGLATGGRYGTYWTQDFGSR